MSRYRKFLLENTADPNILRWFHEKSFIVLQEGQTFPRKFEKKKYAQLLNSQQILLSYPNQKSLSCVSNDLKGLNIKVTPVLMDQRHKIKQRFHKESIQLEKFQKKEEDVPLIENLLQNGEEKEFKNSVGDILIPRNLNLLEDVSSVSNIQQEMAGMRMKINLLEEKNLEMSQKQDTMLRAVQFMLQSQLNFQTILALPQNQVNAGNQLRL